MSGRVTSARFPQFANLWVPLLPADRLPPGAPRALTVAGERLVLFRDADGAPRALPDRCRHRGVALSLGRVENGQITCPFHGWRFDGTGQCRHVPWNPDARLSRLGLPTFPVREVAGLIWLFTGAEPQDEPQAPEALLRPGIRLTAQDFVWNAHWTRVMENMLDTPHLPFVHARTIGKSLRGRTDRQMDLTWQETAHGARARNPAPPCAITFPTSWNWR